MAENEIASWRAGARRWIRKSPFAVMAVGAGLLAAGAATMWELRESRVARESAPRSEAATSRGEGIAPAAQTANSDTKNDVFDGADSFVYGDHAEVETTQPVFDSIGVGAAAGRAPRTEEDFGMSGAKSRLPLGAQGGGAFARRRAAGVRRPAARDDGERVSPGSEEFGRVAENPFKRVADDPLSTFGADVDTASYAIVRRDLRNGARPATDAVRIEELINYFAYDDPAPMGGTPIAVRIEVASCPWRTDHRLVRIGVKAKEVSFAERKPTNLVFLVDVSGSMMPANKLPLLKRSMRLLVDQLGENDRVALVVYAGSSGLVLPSTSCMEKARILEAIERLEAGGSTAGAAGIELAYGTAVASFLPRGNNRVILATDGDFNVGIRDEGALTRLIEEKAKSGVFLSVLGFGMGNLKDARLEKLADKGNGNYAYIDDLAEARKVLVEQMGATLETVAKDVKLQVEFNPAAVSEFRLIGYENRVLAHEDFNNDKKDAGDMGAGHCVTALYEIAPAGAAAAAAAAAASVDPLRYQGPRAPIDRGMSDELLLVKVRYKEPAADSSRLLEFPARDSFARYGQASDDFKFAAAVAAFGMALRESEHRGTATLDAVAELAGESLGQDRGGYRHELLDLVKRAKEIGVK